MAGRDDRPRNHWESRKEEGASEDPTQVNVPLFRHIHRLRTSELNALAVFSLKSRLLSTNDFETYKLARFIVSAED